MSAADDQFNGASGARDGSLSRKNSLLQSWCSERNQAVHEIADGRGDISRTLVLPGTSKTLPIRLSRHGAVLTQLSNVSIDPAGFVATSDRNALNLRSWCETVLATGMRNAPAQSGRSNGSSSYLRDVSVECIFLGGAVDPGEFLTFDLLKLTLLDWLPDLHELPIVIYDDLSVSAIELLDLFGVTAERRISIPRAASKFESVWMLSPPFIAARTEEPVSVWPEALWAARHRLAFVSSPLPLARPRLFLGQPVEGPVGDSLRETLGRHNVIDIAMKSRGVAEIVSAISGAESIVVAAGGVGALTLFAPIDCRIVHIESTRNGAETGPAEFATVIGQFYGRISAMELTAADKSGFAILGQIFVSAPHMIQ
ncbi:MAG: hypothetical protein FJX59_16605 [Alphaproteobacteria bacterium]|nr:hypothetical protein [Alphaproteobacteria bacterium]